MIYNNQININEYYLYLIEDFKKSFLSYDNLYIVGSIADKLIYESLNIETDVIYRDKFKDIDYLLINKEPNINKYDCVNYYYENGIYRIDSSIAETVYDVERNIGYYSDGYLNTINDGLLYPPIWYKEDIEMIYNGKIDYPNMGFIRCYSRNVDLSKEMVEHMNNIIELVYNLDYKWIESLALLFNFKKYEKYINKYNNWSSYWEKFFSISLEKKSESDIDLAQNYINYKKYNI
jgi:hypothetical protein